MAEAHLSNDDFFARLTDLFGHNRRKGHGSVYLTQKRLAFDHGSDAPSPTKVLDDPLWDMHPESPLPILIRASNNVSSKGDGKGRPITDRKNVEKIKLSTIVPPGQIDAFYARYAEVCKAGMSGLRKRDKKKKKKDKKKKKAVEGETKG
ncbi:signal recognition particle, SRP9/SRP14 subunit [Lojkania enalia]|uniref:Signal recognition particle subunit SRP14 n=1 Tax=Lojkania enalia TaxID=147567 RepID=A0A9P4N3H5_9PLEO|nr:signal recognition particle, SRP9/SRP14 subunit [Didymosphaeria enalia]